MTDAILRTARCLPFGSSDWMASPMVRAIIFVSPHNGVKNVSLVDCSILLLTNRRRRTAGLAYAKAMKSRRRRHVEFMLLLSFTRY
jgi:hypothetical protein